MNRREFLKSLTAFIAGISFLPLLPKKQSNQKDTQTTLFDEDVRHYYVNGITGDDSNPGTKDKPWETLHAIPTVIGRNAYIHIDQHPPGGPIVSIKAYMLIAFMKDSKMNIRLDATAVEWLAH